MEKQVRHVLPVALKRDDRVSVNSNYAWGD
jgi:hypothetical protein